MWTNKIADRLIFSRATITDLLDSLERQSYVLRLPLIRLAHVPHINHRNSQEDRKRFSANRPSPSEAWLEVLVEKEQEQFIVSLHRLQDSN